MKQIFCIVACCLLFCACSAKPTWTGPDISLLGPGFKEAKIIFFGEQHTTPVPQLKTLDLIFEYNKQVSQGYFTDIVFELPASLLPFVNELEAEVEKNKGIPDEWRDFYFFTHMELMALEKQQELFEEAKKLGLEGTYAPDEHGLVATLWPIYKIALYNIQYGRAHGKEIHVHLADMEFDSNEETIDMQNTALRNLYMTKEIALFSNKDSKVAVFGGMLHLVPIISDGKNYSLPGIAKRLLKLPVESVIIYGGPIDEEIRAYNPTAALMAVNSEDLTKIKGDGSASVILSEKEYLRIATGIEKDFMQAQPADEVGNWVFYFKTDEIPYAKSRMEKLEKKLDQTRNKKE